MSFRLFGLEWNSRWKTLSIYEKFEQMIVSILTWIIAVVIIVLLWRPESSAFFRLPIPAKRPAGTPGYGNPA